MIDRIEARFRQWWRWLDRSEWSVRLLRLPVVEAAPSSPGLILVQIDGLGRKQLERALAAGRMPFLRRLMEIERYRLHDFYSGVPSSTPAVQAELFYGVKTAVPAFAYYDAERGEPVRMLDPTAAEQLEALLAGKGGEPLLAGGSSYSNIFRGAGGADEAHFCCASMGLGSLLRSAHPLGLALLVLAHLHLVLRALALAVLELGLAIADALRGVAHGQPFIKELTFIPARIAICIGLRELVTAGVKIDIARGLPVVHVNFLGYDEQAHRRGPGAGFAHWALKGIDGCIARIWRAAKASPRRDYRVWVYSDHGQEHVVPYARLHGRSIQAAVEEALGAVSLEGERENHVHSELHLRAGLLHPRLRVATHAPHTGPRARPDGLRVAAAGPVALVYLPKATPAKELDRIARHLTGSAGVPAVLAPEGVEGVAVWMSGERFTLADCAERLLGADHPFCDMAAGDLTALCRHPAAGDLVLLGWRAGVTPVSFAIESGAHGGTGPEETHGFALLANDAALPARHYDHLRALDLRRSALHLLGRDCLTSPGRRRNRGEQRPRLRLMTYNVHSCRGMDGKVSPERIARTIAQLAPDVVALQELDVRRRRTGGVDQAHLIAQHLEMAFEFHPTVAVEEERYGDAILTHLPMRLVKAQPLPGAPHLEPRGALWVAVELEGYGEVQIINTHLGLRPGERRLQVEALLGPEWLGHPDCKGPVVLCGDFNAVPGSYVCRRLDQRLRDSQRVRPGTRVRNTWFSSYPALRIDHVYVGEGIDIVDIDVPLTRLARIASDHLPLVAELRLPLPAQVKSAATPTHCPQQEE